MQLEIGGFTLGLSVSKRSMYGHIGIYSFVLEGISYVKGRDKLIEVDTSKLNEIDIIVGRCRLVMDRRSPTRKDLDQNGVTIPSV
jgi:hypothetical protein